MRVLIYEYICGGGLAGQPLPERLAAEGWAMLSSVVEDFSQIGGVEVLTSLDRRFRRRKLSAQEITWIDSQDEEPLFLLEWSPRCDGVLVIAPEFDGVLYQRCRWVEQAGGRLLGPSPAAIALTADKLALNRHLARHGVPVPVSCAVSPGPGFPRGFPYPVVWKPRWGVGSENIHLVRDAAEADKLAATLVEAAASDSHSTVGHNAASANDAGTNGAFVLEQFVAGQAASVAFLVGPSGAVSLMPASQRLSSDGRFRYLGGEVPLPGADRESVTELARRAVEVVPGLRGYVGVDLVCPGGNSQSPKPEALSPEGGVIIEINPRLTTSYIGLRALFEGNLAEQMLRVLAGQPAELYWKSGPVRFSASGRVQHAAIPSRR